MFGPVMLLYFLAHRGSWGHRTSSTGPRHPGDDQSAERLPLFRRGFRQAFTALGSVVLAVTGAEALYADMGHFGRKPIRVSWLYFVLPALLLNYMGQGAMILSADSATALAKVKDPFFYLAPDMLRLPLVLVATAAAIIASQAVISGAFSVTQQAIQLGFVPRLRIRHTSESAAGQIYIPLINWALMVDGHPARDQLPHLHQPRRGLRNRRDWRDADRLRPDRRGPQADVELEPLRRRAACWRSSSSSTAPTSPRTCRRSPTAAGSRCSSAASPSPS